MPVGIGDERPFRDEVLFDLGGYAGVERPAAGPPVQQLLRAAARDDQGGVQVQSGQDLRRLFTVKLRYGRYTRLAEPTASTARPERELATSLLHQNQIGRTVRHHRDHRRVRAFLVFICFLSNFFSRSGLLSVWLAIDLVCYWSSLLSVTLVDYWYLLLTVDDNCCLPT